MIRPAGLAGTITRAAAAAAAATRTITAIADLMKAEKVFFIYVAKNKEWQRMQAEDWGYVSAMSRFYKWWMRRYFDVELPVEATVSVGKESLVFQVVELVRVCRATVNAK